MKVEEDSDKLFNARRVAHESHDAYFALAGQDKRDSKEVDSTVSVGAGLRCQLFLRTSTLLPP